MQHPLWGAFAAPDPPKDIATLPVALGRAVTFGFMIAGLASCGAPARERPSAKTAPPVAVAAASLESAAPGPVVDETAARNVEMVRHWQGFGVPNCSYLAPKEDFIEADGGIDVVFHFHAGQMSERELRESGVRGVFVSCGYGIGTSGYSHAFEDRGRFGWMMKRLTTSIGAAAKRRDVHLRRLALASWSAGFAAVSRILAVPEWYDAADTVILLDSLHARYIAGSTPGTVEGELQKSPARGADRVDVRMLRHFVRFAADAAARRKTMVITHSAIVPPDYASTAESTAALLFEVGVTPLPADEKNARGMEASVRADEGGLHVRGFRGTGPQDHIHHLHLIGETLRSWLVPRWYTSAGERP
jgi:hypothetical protein